MTFDLSAELMQFHDTHVRLDDDAKRRLREVRDLNLARIRDGLGDLGYPSFKEWRNQGGYAMETVINDPMGESNHDIDVALIFEDTDLPAPPLSARQRVRDALCKRGNNFLADPEARTNAVTVWYADGYHLDFALYRRSTSYMATKHEHASTQWVERDPGEVTSWFNAAVDAQSPKPGAYVPAATVRARQLRRIVRLVKWFCRSRSSWSLPGGMITSALVVECYRPHLHRDDIALLDTLSALQSRLQGNCRVYHPCGGSRELTAKTEFLNQVQRLRDRLIENLPKLGILADTSCTREQARSAWDWIFNHAYWSGKEVLEEAAVAKAATGLHGYHVRLGCDLAKGGEYGKIIGPYREMIIPKNMGLRFYVAETSVPTPYLVRFEVENTGDEARVARETEWRYEKTNENAEHWTSSKYKGTHRMTCSIMKGGQIVASASMLVKVAGGLWRGRR